MNKIFIDTYFTKDKIVKVVNNEIEYLNITSKHNKSLVGNVYVGRIVKIINKNFAFINIGDDKNAFLDLSDTKENLNVDFENNKKLKVKQGDKIVVQVLRDKTTEKGALVTSQVNYKGENMVIYRMLTPNVAVSKKIEDEKVRKKLKTFGKKIMIDNFAILFRTSAKEVNFDLLTDEYTALVDKALNLENIATMQKPPMVLDKGEDKELEQIKRLINIDTEILTNNKDVFEEIRTYLDVNKYSNELAYEDKPIIVYDIQKKIDKVFNKKIWLKSGGFLFIEQTEASVIIDVNTGKNTKTKNRRALIVKTNTEAIIEIAKQIKLRNLSGIIIVDLIDCKTEDDLETVKKVARDTFKSERVSVNVVGITSLGLLEITRKKVGDSIADNNKVECVCCKGEGMVFDYDYIVDNILNSVYNLKDANGIIIKANAKVIEYIATFKMYLIDKLKNENDINISLEKIVTGKVDYFELELMAK